MSTAPEFLSTNPLHLFQLFEVSAVFLADDRILPREGDGEQQVRSLWKNVAGA